MYHRAQWWRLSSLCVAVVAGLWNASFAAEFEFQSVPGFVKLPEDIALGACSAVAVNSRGEVLLFHRGKRPILCLDAEGRYLRSWGDGVISAAHGLRIDREDNVWATDTGSHRVLKFSPAGELLLALGTGKPGTGIDEFNKPTDVAFGPRNEIYVADGYGNSRVMKFSPEGRFILAWGQPGQADGEFDLPHSIIVDAAGRVLVGDRENDRIQVFDGDGRWLDCWKGFAPYGLAFDRHGTLFVADARTHKALRLDERGRILQSWGGKGAALGQFNAPHMLAVDAVGNLYVAEVDGRRLQKFVRK